MMLLCELCLRIYKDLGKDAAKEHKMKLAVYAVNASVGQKGLCPTLLVFGAIPRHSRRTPLLDQYKSANSANKSIEDAEVEQEKRVPGVPGWSSVEGTRLARWV